ncbi:hypothetical protein TRAPUB_5005 [Trametes pubescens]|uniref:Uncharacterized protein n=1 Tax=Trametes pubescens TaxID=154538 RepID=A0A1M2V9F4_TRAPU|nr:hypothetical protein TRAPUB_5005 [Trametes pubescens]
MLPELRTVAFMAFPDSSPGIKPLVRSLVFSMKQHPHGRWYGSTLPQPSWRAVVDRLPSLLPFSDLSIVVFKSSPHWLVGFQAIFARLAEALVGDNDQSGPTGVLKAILAIHPPGRAHGVCGYFGRTAR